VSVPQQCGANGAHPYGFASEIP